MLDEIASKSVAFCKSTHKNDAKIHRNDGILRHFEEVRRRLTILADVDEGNETGARAVRELQEKRKAWNRAPNAN